MKFYLKPNRKRKVKHFLLDHDNWDDWFRHRTLYGLSVFNVEKKRYFSLGGVKIGAFNMKAGQRSPSLPEKFESLDETFFSVGQDVSYYTNLNQLTDEERIYVLTDHTPVFRTGLA